MAPQVSAFASSGSELVCEAFEAADKDGSGTLDADELQLVIETLPISITVEEVEREIGAGTNRNDDGKLSIDLETLTAWWKTHESVPRGELTASVCAGPRGLGHAKPGVYKPPSECNASTRHYMHYMRSIVLEPLPPPCAHVLQI